MANNEMFIKDKLDPDYGKISYDYLPAGVVPTATPNLNQVLNAGNQALGQNIDAKGGDVLCDVMKCISIQPVAFPLVDTIEVNGNLGMIPTSKLAFADNAIITANYSGSPEKSVIRTINAGSNTTYQIAEANISYDTSTKLLTINPPSIPPAPLLSTQGLNVKGQITAQYGGVSADNVIQTNSIFASRDGTQPRVEFQDSAGYAHGQVGWNTITGRTILAGDNGFKINQYGDKYKIEGSDSIGYLGIETSGVDTEIRHYDSTATTMETRVRVNGGGNMSIGGAYDGSLFLEKTGGGYGGINIDGGSNINVFSAGGDIITNQALRPDGGIKDTTNSTGSAGQFLGKDGANQLKWETTVPGGWSGTATTDLNMNQFQILNVPTINMEKAGNPTINFNDTSAPSAMMYLEAVPTTASLYATSVSQFQVWTGAVEGVQMGNDSVYNYVRGLGLPMRVAQDQLSESSTYMLINSGDVELASGNGGQISITTAGAIVNTDNGITLNAIGTQVTVNAPNCIKLTGADVNTVLIDQLDGVASLTTAVPFVNAGKIGGININDTNPPIPSSYLTVSDPFSWIYSGTYAGINSNSRYCSTKYVEVEFQGVCYDIADSIIWGIDLEDTTTGTVYLSDFGSWGFNDTRPASETSHTTDWAKGISGVRVHSPSIKTYFDISGTPIPDGNQCRIRIWAISYTGAHTISELRWIVKVRPVNQFI